MLTPEEIEALAELQAHLVRMARPPTPTMAHVSQNAHSAIGKLLKREEELRVAATELVDKIVFRVLNTIDRSEVWSDARKNPDSYRQAVRMTLVSFGILEPETRFVMEMGPQIQSRDDSDVVRIVPPTKPIKPPCKAWMKPGRPSWDAGPMPHDGQPCVLGSNHQGPHSTFDHSKRTTKHFQNLLGYCVCDHCRELPQVERGPGPFKTGLHAESCPKTRDHSLACECYLKTNYDPQRIVRSAEDRRLPHETVLLRQVLVAVDEHGPALGMTIGGRAQYKRRPHDDVVTDAVYATLAALGFTIRLDGTIAVQTQTTGQDNETDKQE